MEIEGMGIKIVEQLAEKGLIKDLADLYLLKETDFLALEGFAEKKTDRSPAKAIPQLSLRGVSLKECGRSIIGALPLRHMALQHSLSTIFHLKRLYRAAPHK